MKEHLTAVIICLSICTVFWYFGPDSGRFATNGSILDSIFSAFLFVLFFVPAYLLAGVPLRICKLPQWTKLLTVLGLFFLFALIIATGDSDLATSSTSEIIKCILTVVVFLWLLSLTYGIPLVLATYYFKRKSTGRTESATCTER